MRFGWLFLALLLFGTAAAQEPSAPITLPTPEPDLSFLQHHAPVHPTRNSPACNQAPSEPTSLSGPCVVNQKNRSCAAPFGTKRTTVVGNMVAFGGSDFFERSDLSPRSEEQGTVYKLLYFPFGLDAWDAPLPCPQQLLPQQMTTDGSIQWRFEGHPPSTERERSVCAEYPQEVHEIAPGKYQYNDDPHAYHPVPHSPFPMPADLHGHACLYVEQWSAARLTGQVVLAYAIPSTPMWFEEIFFRSDATGEIYRLLYWNLDYGIDNRGPADEQLLFTQTTADGHQHWTMDVRPPETPEEAKECSSLPTITVQTSGQPDKTEELTGAYMQPEHSPHPRPADLHGHPCLYIEKWSLVPPPQAAPHR